MTTIKLDKNTNYKLKELKRLQSEKSLNSIVDKLVDKELKKYCLTQNGYTKVKDKLLIDGKEYTIKDIVETTVYAQHENELIEFYVKGKIAWNAKVIK